MNDQKQHERFHYPLWSRGDLDGFFGLMVDNLVQVLLIIALSTSLAGLPAALIYARVLPGVAISLLVGNVFYGLQARYVARRDRNATCTALPYGINTPSVIAYAFFIMGPVYREYEPSLGSEAAGALAWKAGLIACLVSGLVELGGAFFAERLRRVTPRAALLGVLAALGVTFIASDFAFRIYAKPWIGLVPMGILLLSYFSRYRFPLGVPGGFIAIVVGTLIAWITSIPTVADALGLAALQSVGAVRDGVRGLGWVTPVFSGGELLEVLSKPEITVRFLTISIPMGAINLLGSLQNIESAEAGGDRFATAPSLAANGVGSIVASLFGSCFPTTIYIGHPGWKALGARAGYSILNGAFFTVCFLAGAGPLLAALIPIEAGAAIVMYIGIIIAAQAFQATPREHAPAVAMGFFPAMAALLTINLPLFMADSGATRTMAQMLSDPAPVAQVAVLPGLVALTGANSAWLVVTLILTAIGVALIERKYGWAAVWAAVGSALTAIGLLHAYRVEGNVVRELFLWQSGKASAGPSDAAAGDVFLYRGWSIAIGYGLMALLFLAIATVSRQEKDPEGVPVDIPRPDDASKPGDSERRPDAGLPE